MRRRLLATSLVALAACDPEPFTVLVSVRDTAVIAYRDGDGAWTPVSPGRSGRARIRITSGRYSLAWICNWDFYRHAYVVHSTVADEPQAHCTNGPDAPELALEGVTSPHATVYVEGRVVIAGLEGGYFVGVTPGVHDVVAMSSTRDRMLVQRDVEVGASRLLDLPVGDRGEPTAMVQAQIFGPPQSVTLSSELRTRNGDHVVVPSSGDLVVVFPDSVLVASDRAFVRAEGEHAPGERCSAQVRMSSSPRIELPEPPVAAVTRQKVYGLPDAWRYVELVVRSRIDSAAYTISATADWLDEAGADDLEIPDLALLPGISLGLVPIRPGDPVSWDLYTERGELASELAWCETHGNVTW